MKPSPHPIEPPQEGRRRVLALALSSALLAAGCTTTRLSPMDSNAYWSGRMALQVLKDPPESLSAGFELQGSAQAGEMVLISPQGARLTQGQQQIDSPSLQKLGSRLTGTELPIAALFEWLAGRPAEAVGWQVDLSAHAQGRISAERRETSPGAVLRIALDR